MLEARFRSWWQQIKQRRVAITVTSAIIMVAIALIIIGYWFDVPGFNGYTQISTIRTLSGPTAGTITRTEVYLPGKTLWDWLQLLIIPLALAIIALLFNRAERKNEQRIASDNQQEAALQGYLNEISELMLEKDLRKSDTDAEVRIIARVRTLTVLPRLDGGRKRSILEFLCESKLIERNKPIIDLGGADFSRADLSSFNLTGTELGEVILSHANLSGASLAGAILNHADLSGANLSNTGFFAADLIYVDLKHANLSGASLIGAKLRGADLNYADLSGADLTRADLSAPFLNKGNLWSNAMLARAKFGADLSKARLFGANLTEADLREALVTPEQLDTAKSLQGAIMPDEANPP